MGNQLKKFGKAPLGDKIFIILIYILLAVIMLVVFLPLVYIVSASFSDPQAVISNEVWFLPVRPTLRGYQAVFKNRNILTGFANSFYYMIVGTLVNIVMTVMCAYPLSRKEFTARNKVAMIFVFTMYFSGGLIPTYMVIKALGLIDNFFVFIFPGMINIYWMILVRTYIEGLPKELFEAASSEGAGEFTIFLKVVLPLSMPVLATILLFSAISHWNAWYDSYIYTYKPQLKTLQAVLVKILNQYQTGAMVSQAQQMANEAKKMPVSSESIRMTVTMVATLPIILVYPFLQKYFIKGMLIGAVKD